MTPTRARTLEGDGPPLHVEETGDGAPTIVLVNGLFQTTTSWRPVVDDLGRYCRVIAYDRRNQGRSTTALEVTFEQHVDDLIRVIEDQPGRPVTLVAHSFGCRLALELLTRAPRLIARTVLVSTGVAPLAARYRTIFRSWRDAISTEERARFVEVLSCWLYSCAFVREHPTLHRQLGAAFAEQPTTRLRSSIDTALDAYRPDRLQSLAPAPDGPVIVLQGEQDYITPPCEVVRLREMVPSARFKVVAKAGHALCTEAPGAVTAGILEGIDG